MKILGKEITTEWLRNNIGLLVLIPTLIGGTWQMMELIWLDSSYVRFFSLSQLVSDGLLVLFVLFIFTLAVWVIFLVDDNFFLKLVLNRDKYQNVSTVDKAEERFFIKDTTANRTSKVIGWVLFMISVTYGVYSLYPFMGNGWSGLPFEGSIIKPSNFFVTAASLAGFLILFFAAGKGLSNIFGWELNLHNKRFRKGMVTVAKIFIPALFLWLLIKIPTLFHHAFVLPDNLKNRNYIEQQVRNSNPNLKNWEIAYFNDKFIFIAIEDSSNKKMIEVMEFNAMFSPLTSH